VVGFAEGESRACLLSESQWGDSAHLLLRRNLEPWLQELSSGRSILGPGNGPAPIWCGLRLFLFFFFGCGLRHLTRGVHVRNARGVTEIHSSAMTAQIQMQESEQAQLLPSDCEEQFGILVESGICTASARSSASLSGICQK
jgi:hypothetical protein